MKVVEITHFVEDIFGKLVYPLTILSLWSCRYEFEMQYGSIGWSVGALLGYAQALKGVKRVIACIGDGSFQVCDYVHICLLSLK